MKKKYYSVAGVNGYDVYSDYEKALETKVYLKKWKVKKHGTFEEAIF